MSSLAALIPARSGSKRVPDKNIRQLGDHPLIAYTISAAINSGIFDSVIVSTDSQKYSQIATHYGAECLGLRPPEIAGSKSPDIEWVEHALDQLKTDGREPDCFSILRPTSPFRLAGTIQLAWKAFQGEEGVDSLRAVEKVSQHPGKMWVVRGRRMMPLMALSPAEQPWHSTQMAALPDVYVQNASLEIAWTKVIRGGGNIAGTVLMPFLTDELEGFDINSEYDWSYAEDLLARGRAKLPEVNAEPFAG